jgi:hypothetical protein
MTGAGRLSAQEPCWILDGPPVGEPSRDEVTAFFDAVDNVDRHLLTLLYGCGLDIGEAAFVLALDPALAHWRVQSALTGGLPERDAAALERGVHRLLGADRDQDTPWNLSRLIERLPPDARSRLEACLGGQRHDAGGDEGRSGLGIGSAVIIALAIAAFMVYGAIRDVSPVWRGRDRMRLGDFQGARRAFEELGKLPEARMWTAIAWLAEGQFDRANEVLLTGNAAGFLGAFRPMDRPLDRLDVDPASGALLPRGVISTQRPDFVFRAEGVGELVIEGVTPTEPPRPLPVIRIPLDAAQQVPPFARLVYPADLRDLHAGSYVWTVPGSETAPAPFTVLGEDQRRELQRHSWQRLTQEIPLHARTFLRGHYFLRNGLYMQAGLHFANLATTFPEQDYPRQMLQQIAEALDVDPSVFLR